MPELDGTKDQSDVTLTTGNEGTPEELPESLTREQVQKLVRDTRSAVMADVGRMKTEANKAMEAAKGAQERLTQMIRQQEEAELEVVKDEPDKYTAIQERQKRRVVEQELTEAKERLQSIEKERAEAKKIETSQQIATRLNVDAKRLTNLARFTDGSAEAIEEIAKDLPKLSEKPVLRPDSNVTLGGLATREQIIAAYTKDPRDPAVRQRYMDLRREEGR